MPLWFDVGDKWCPHDLMLGQFLAHKWFLEMFQFAHILKIYTRKETISIKNNNITKICINNYYISIGLVMKLKFPFKKQMKAHEV